MTPAFCASGGDVFYAGLPLDDTDTEHFYALFVDEQTAAYRSADIIRLRRFNGLLASLSAALAARANWRRAAA